MSKSKARSDLLRLVDSDSEDEFGGRALEVARIATVTHSKKQNCTMPPTKRARAGRQPANRVTKPAPKTSNSRRRPSDRIAAAAEEAITGGRTGANSKGTGRGRGRRRGAAVEEGEQQEDTVMTEASAPAAVTPLATKQKGSRGRPKKVVIEAETNPAVTRRGRKATVRNAEVEVEEVSETPETQQPDATQSGVDDGRDDLADLPMSQTPARVGAGRGSAPLLSSISKRPLHGSSPDKSEPALRRRLGEMTQKHESLEHKYRDLKEIAVKEAERNFDKLKKQSEEKSRAADQLITTLKAELAAQKEASKEIQWLKTQLEESESKTGVLQAKVTELTTAVADSKAEIKSLNLKLTAARNAEAAATAAAKVPGSAMKGSTAASRLAAANASEAIQRATLAAQKKEDLYGDLTGLIVRSVKREGGEDMFDCIQTGRNGTLHFKLAVEVDTENGGGVEAHCHYTPQLDANRDRALIAVLPGYLVDEISFPQAQAGKFYARVLKALNEQPAA
ncbi:chromosome segregation protein Csm1/Pcs1-domain-containing protein [Chaetomium strumarium]|uniref:Chromosome segregation protein Csm1/Pcs1-domain-containing protein n=1 Tax=Chaetomium strumarium TaxID=1170767 RepID=A0AAJ0GVM1_9PEZI|nr:chromosome segregation protein Csm1/Pcs1-domain-containing protein [Chaetomium strumarium]